MIRQIRADELDALVPVFDEYMVFYEQPSAPERYRAYLQERLEREEAIVFGFFADTGRLAGFVLNYLSFSSLSLGRIVVLNDLFVRPESRGRGIAEALIRRVWDMAGECGAVRVDLGTAKTNVVAQRLYERVGFIRDNEFFAYRYIL
jgi:ribosomal protein S18 acetylase RimI-like enzyme